MSELDTKDKILEAAKEEFAAVGEAGARIDALAKAAGCNKQLIYHYFGDKRGLYEAVMADVLSDRPVLAFQSRAELADHLARSAEDVPKRRVWLRLLMWEALADDGGALVAEERRRAFVGHAVNGVERAQEAGFIDRCFLPRFIFLAMFSMVLMPFLLPQMTRLVTGLAPSDPSFRRQWADTLRLLARRLGPPPAECKGEDPP